VEDDLVQFKNLGEFFYRKLKNTARPIHGSAEMVSPVDGTVLITGKINSGEEMIKQIKNVSYSVNALLGDRDTKYSSSKEKKLYYAVIYLAPGDYHRFHSPVSWQISNLRHFAGEMLSVSPWIVSKIPNLFVLNERIACLGEWRHGFFAFVPVIVLIDLLNRLLQQTLEIFT
jgi:phosphatidylserine decarboxylase